MEKSKPKEGYYVQINHPMYSIHTVAENLTSKEAIKAAKELSSLWSPCFIYICKEHLHENGYTIVHESLSYANYLEEKKRRAKTIEISPRLIEYIENNTHAGELSGNLHCNTCGRRVVVDWFEQELQCTGCDEL